MRNLSALLVLLSIKSAAQVPHSIEYRMISKDSAMIYYVEDNSQDSIKVKITDKNRQTKMVKNADDAYYIPDSPPPVDSSRNHVSSQQPQQSQSQQNFVTNNYYTYGSGYYNGYYYPAGYYYSGIFYPTFLFGGYRPYYAPNYYLRHYYSPGRCFYPVRVPVSRPLFRPYYGIRRR